jgi:catechol 2,3-dioxygenase-like lactoylglutathione lyase family enzyme
MRTSGINHVSVHANDLEESARFYIELLDAILLDTPNFGVPVQWLGLGDTQLHLFLRNTGATSGFHHFGITVEDLEPVYRRAEALGAFDDAHGHHFFELPGDVAQLYVRDPAGNLMEIDTPGASRLPEALRRQMRKLADVYPQSEQNLRGRLYVKDPAAA